MHTSGFLWERAWKEGTEREHGAWKGAGVVHPVLSVLSLFSQPSVRRDLTGVLVCPPSMRKRQPAPSASCLLDFPGHIMLTCPSGGCCCNVLLKHATELENRTIFQTRRTSHLRNPLYFNQPELQGRKRTVDCLLAEDKASSVKTGAPGHAMHHGLNCQVSGGETAKTTKGEKGSRRS